MFSYANLTEETTIEEAFITYAEIGDLYILNDMNVGSWKFKQIGTELHFMYNNVVKQRMFQDGSFVATGEVAAYSQGVAADTLDLLRLNLNQGGGDSKYLSSTTTQIYFDIGRSIPFNNV